MINIMGFKALELKDTVELMTSADYKDRFKAEYQQLVVRWSKLNSMLINWEDGKLDFEPTCPYEILSAQRDIMNSYMSILRYRAELEGIDIYEH